jgi:hypothetical protein
LRVRLAFCDAPEKKQAFGTRAKQAMSELVFGKDIELRTHAIDRYGRTVEQVDIDGKDVGEEEEAKAEQAGLWSDPNSIPPWIFRNLAKAGQQQAIASNWIEAHQKQIDPNTPIAQLALPSPLASPVNSDDVWVNTRSGKYWKPGSLYDGKTKRGEYMSEEEAVQKGYLPANGTGE